MLRVVFNKLVDDQILMFNRVYNKWEITIQMCKEAFSKLEDVLTLIHKQAFNKPVEIIQMVRVVGFKKTLSLFMVKIILI